MGSHVARVPRHPARLDYHSSCRVGFAVLRKKAVFVIGDGAQVMVRAAGARRPASPEPNVTLSRHPTFQ